MSKGDRPADVFNAIADPRRRQILELLSGGRFRAVGELVAALCLPQPAVSKHLGVLRRAGVVSVDFVGRRRRYRINAEALRPIRDWIKTFERSGNESFDRLDGDPRESRDWENGPERSAVG